MKTLIKILILTILFYLCFSLVNQNAAGAQDKKEDKAQTQEQIVNIPENDDFEMDDEEYSYGQDMISRKALEKKLEPLSQKERIIWSFRSAKTNSFL